MQKERRGRVGDRMVVSQSCFFKLGDGLQGKCVWENPKRKQTGRDQGQEKGEGEMEGVQASGMFGQPPDSGFLKG